MPSDLDLYLPPNEIQYIFEHSIAPSVDALEYELLRVLRSGDHYTLLNLARRLEYEGADPWADFLHVKQKLPELDATLTRRAASTARKRPAAKKATAKKAPARKSAARKSPAKKAPSRKRG